MNAKRLSFPFPEISHKKQKTDEAQSMYSICIISGSVYPALLKHGGGTYIFRYLKRALGFDSLETARNINQIAEAAGL